MAEDLDEFRCVRRAAILPPQGFIHPSAHDFPAGGWRIRELAEGIHYTIVNGQVLIEDGRHTGALPGRVLRNALCQTS